MTDTQIYALLNERLNRVENKLDVVVDHITGVREQLVALRIKMAFIGGIAGILTAGAVSFLVRLWT